MGFLSVINIIAMVVGYIVIISILIFGIWILFYMLKEKLKRKKWEKEKSIKETTADILKEKGIETKESAETQPTTETSSSEQTEKKPEENKEGLVDEEGKLKMAD